jgi:ABC-type transporter Mla MlaB component
MLKIERIVSRERTTLLLLGKLRDEWVDELRAELRRVRPLKGSCLNLSQLSFIDARGVELLQKFQSEGVELSHVPPFVGALMQLHAPRK